ncbi:hypothetical protein U8C35_27125 (plasmid) [Sinorhizobium medicae]|uniref:hypothetical protein n=1 Tax=Sinorhizobium medicae TaxID=110321 RepID=UPI002AF6ACEB|nr:hypothetical protein [Sinorhizobium medicae]WQO62071.1 hypothetical protein U8C35_27125 [Sinorhizobium medicae]
MAERPSTPADKAHTQATAEQQFEAEDIKDALDLKREAEQGDAPVSNLSGSSPLTEQWQRCAEKLRAQVAKSLGLYWRECRTTAKKHKLISTAAMVLGLATPLIIAEASKVKPLFGVKPEYLHAAAFVTSLSVALLEGFRRIGKFDSRWANSYRDATDIKRARDTFEINTIGYAVGTSSWIKSFREYRAAYHTVIDRDISRISSIGSDAEPEK